MIKHSTHFYVDQDGKQLGGFGDGAKPTDPDAIRVLVAPNKGDDVWNGTTWDAAIKSEAEIYAEIDADTDAENSKGARADRQLLFRLMKANSPDPANYTKADFRKARRKLIANMTNTGE